MKLTLALALLLPPIWTFAEQVDSIPTPTALQQIVSSEGARVTHREDLGSISSPDASLAIASVAAEEGNGGSARGLHLALSEGDRTGDIYLNEAYVPVLIDELKSLEPLYRCDAVQSCTRGIARCRPSQPEKQAYCVGYYYSAGGEDYGLLFQTGSQSFLLQGVEPSAPVDILSAYRDKSQSAGATSPQ